jgi:hypothetical protein
MPTAGKKPTDEEIESRVDACIPELMKEHGNTKDLVSAAIPRVFSDTIPTDHQLEVMKERVAYWEHPEKRAAEEQDEYLHPRNLGVLLSDLAESMKDNEGPGVVEARSGLEEASRSWEQGDQEGTAMKLYLACNELWLAVRRKT